MYRVTVALGQSGKADVGLAQVPVATPTPVAAANVAFLIGETPGLTLGQIRTRCKDLVDRLVESCKPGLAAAGVRRILMSAPAGAADMTQDTTNGLPADTAIAVVFNSSDTDGKTIFLTAALEQAYKVFHEACQTGALTIKP